MFFVRILKKIVIRTYLYIVTLSVKSTLTLSVEHTLSKKNVFSLFILIIQEIIYKLINTHFVNKLRCRIMLFLDVLSD